MTRVFQILLFPLLFLSAVSPPQNESFKVKDFSYLIGMPGFDEKPLKLHFMLYQGYVNNTNDLLATLKALRAKGETNTPIYAEIKRRLMWEYDGMRMHEYYFENLGGKGTMLDPKGTLYNALVAEFGSYENWMSDFKETGAMRGIGWSVLVRDPKTGKLTNEWIDEHDHGHLVAGQPLLVMDVWEHAYMVQYGTDRKAYIGAFFDNINWPIVEKRFASGS